MIIWELNQNLKIENQNVKLEILDNEADRIGKKTINSIHRTKLLSKWIERPRTKSKFPPLGRSSFILSIHAFSFATVSIPASHISPKGELLLI